MIRPPSPTDYARMSNKAREAAAVLVAEIEQEAEAEAARRIAARERGLSESALIREDAERHRLAALRRFHDTPTQQRERRDIAEAANPLNTRGVAA